MNKFPGLRITRSWTKVQIAKPPASGLHSTPPKDPPAPGDDEVDENSTTQATTVLRKDSPKYKSLHSETMNRMWTQPGFREKRSAAYREAYANMSPEAKEKRLANIRDLSPEANEKRLAAWRVTMSSPEYKEKRSAAMREAWLNMSPETREKRSAAMREAASSPEQSSSKRKRKLDSQADYKAIWAARLSAEWKIPEKKDTFLREKLFRRDDDNPKMQMMWERMRKEAETYADNLNTAELRVQYHNAFIHLHLDAAQYDSELDHTTTLRKSARARLGLSLSDAQLSKLKEKFFENVLLTSSPTMSSKAFDELAEELQCGNKNGWLRKRLNKERKLWIRAATVLRKKGIHVDYAHIPHLAWLEEVGRL